VSGRAETGSCSPQAVESSGELLSTLERKCVPMSRLAGCGYLTGVRIPAKTQQRLVTRRLSCQLLAGSDCPEV